MTLRVRGHPIHYEEAGDGLGAWVYADGVGASRELDYDGVIENRPCSFCGKRGRGADPCMGYLPDVDYGCCGHGIEPCYVVWEHGLRTTGQVLKRAAIDRKATA